VRGEAETERRVADSDSRESIVCKRWYRFEEGSYGSYGSSERKAQSEGTSVQSFRREVLQVELSYGQS
jgi:hypothetical protein